MGSFVSMSDVSVVKNGKKIIDSIDVDIDIGESAAIIGPNGSGKTTFIDLLTGDVHPYSDEKGRMTILGKENISIFELKESISSVSMDIQTRFGDDTLVSDVVLSGFFGGIDVFKNNDITVEMTRSVLDSAVKLGIDDLLDSQFSTLSQGEKRRALIARALVTEPKVLILDEPMTGLDPSMKIRFRKMLDILIDSGVGMVIVTHDPNDIPQRTDRIIALKNGKKYADGRKDEIIDSKTLSDLYDEKMTVVSTDGSYLITYG